MGVWVLWGLIVGGASLSLVEHRAPGWRAWGGTCGKGAEWTEVTSCLGQVHLGYKLRTQSPRNCQAAPTHLDGGGGASAHSRVQGAGGTPVGAKPGAAVRLLCDLGEVGSLSGPRPPFKRGHNNVCHLPARVPRGAAEALCEEGFVRREPEAHEGLVTGCSAGLSDAAAHLIKTS